MYIDEIDAQGLLFWYNDVCEVIAELSRKVK